MTDHFSKSRKTLCLVKNLLSVDIAKAKRLYAYTSALKEGYSRQMLQQYAANKIADKSNPGSQGPVTLELLVHQQD
jgi:hypothetical protein